MKFLFLIRGKQSEFSGSYRINRLEEEVKKRGDEMDLFFSRDYLIEAGGVFLDKKKFDFNDYDVVYSVGNSIFHHYILEMINGQNIATWPSPKHFFISDKFSCGAFLNSIDIPTPKTILLSSKDFSDIEEHVNEVGGFPAVIKKVTGTEGEFVDLVNSSEEVLDFMNWLPFPTIGGKKNIILQEYIKESKGSDFRVYCVGNEILGAIKRTANGENFKANISLGGSAEKMDLTDSMIDHSRKIMEKGKLLFAGIDFIKSNGGYMVIEINTTADFMGFEKVTGINVAGKIIDQLKSMK